MSYPDNISEYNEEIEKAIDEASPALPEAPLSTHIDAYYKGFHAGITIRSQDNSSIPVSKIVAAINNLIEQGFEPSWNKTTSREQLNPDPIMEVTRSVSTHPCKTCGGRTEYKSGKTKTGKDWAGYFCQSDKDHVEWQSVSQ
jgi:hypothetical protein